MLAKYSFKKLMILIVDVTFGEYRPSTHNYFLPFAENMSPTSILLRMGWAKYILIQFSWCHVNFSDREFETGEQLMCTREE